MLWVAQLLVAFTFLYSGVCKALLSEKKLVAMGQTGVEGLPTALIRFIGFAEILGVAGLILPRLIQVFPLLTPVAALFLAFIMPPAARIHYRRKEYKSVVLNSVLFMLCLFIAYGRYFIAP